MDHEPPHHDELLASVHDFPGPYQFKVIGIADDDFVERVVQAASAELADLEKLEYRVRSTAGGRHLAVTLEVYVETPAQVRSIYAGLKAVEGVAMLL